MDDSGGSGGGRQPVVQLRRRGEMRKVGRL